MSLRVGLDAQIFLAQRRGGISRYFVELMRAFETDSALGVDVVTPYRDVANEHLVETFPDRYRLDVRHDSRWRGLLRPRRLRAMSDVDLVHHTFYDPAYLEVAAGLPAVSTVHDMIPELFPDDFPHGNPHAAKERFVRSSAGLVCVSETTRRDLLRLYGPLDAEIAVVPLGVGDEFRTPRVTKVSGPSSFVLFVGHRGGYKGFDVLVRAMARRPELAELHLVCVGGGAFSLAEQRLLAQANLTERVHRPVVPDAELPGLYAIATCLVYPSRYEGFGLPILEAFAASCPVIAADTEIFREVADDAAAYFPPDDAAALADALGTCVRDQAWRRARTDAGRARAADFTWSRTAAATADLYRRVLA